jgi:hypothetical protein
VHDELHDVGAMRLVRRPGWVRLHRADDAFFVARDQEDRAAMRGREMAAPPVERLLGSDRKETDRSAGIDGIHQQLGERMQVRFGDRQFQALDHAPLHGRMRGIQRGTLLQ